MTELDPGAERAALDWLTLVDAGDAVFEHKRASVETVTPMRDTDGQWRVSGYFVR